MQRTGSPLFSDWIYVSSCVLTIEYVTFLDMGFLLEELKEILQIIKHSFYYLSWTWCNNSIPPVITADVNIPKRNKMKLFHFARISLQQRGIESHDNFCICDISLVLKRFGIIKSFLKCYQMSVNWRLSSFITIRSMGFFCLVHLQSDKSKRRLWYIIVYSTHHVDSSRNKIRESSVVIRECDSREWLKRSHTMELEKEVRFF